MYPKASGVHAKRNFRSIGDKRGVPIGPVRRSCGPRSVSIIRYLVKLQSDGGHGLNGLDSCRSPVTISRVVYFRFAIPAPSRPSFSTLLTATKADMSPKEPKTGSVGDTYKASNEALTDIKHNSYA